MENSHVRLWLLERRRWRRSHLLVSDRAYPCRAGRVWRNERKREDEEGMQETAANNCCSTVYVCAYLSLCTCLFECVCVSICGSCVRPTAVLRCMSVLRLWCCAQQTGWRNNGCHLSAWEGSVMDCIHVEVVDWQHSKTKDINSTLTAQKTTQPALPNRAQRAILILMRYSVFHKNSFF